MKSYAEIEGMELDWFAADLAGNLAIFATAGAGFVPLSVFESRILYQDIADGIDTPHWGSAQIWDDYATLGLFVYDWVLHAGPYKRMRIPAHGIAEHLRQKIVSLPGLPRFPFEFSRRNEISVGAIEDAT